MMRTSQELADRLQIPERTIVQWRYLGKGPKFVRAGCHVRYADDDIDRWVNEHTVDPVTAA